MNKTGMWFYKTLIFSTSALLTVLSACQKQDRIPFEEGKTLVCPQNTRKAVITNTSYPEYYCVGTSGRMGPWLEFDVNGRIRTRTQYVDDHIEGEWTHYHPDGTVETKGQIKKDMRIGEWTQFYINGAPRSIKTYVDNHQTGPVKLYYQTGSLMAEGSFVEDFEEGPWKVYTPKGELARECQMVHGEETNCIIHLKDFQPSTYHYNSKENGAL